MSIENEPLKNNRVSVSLSFFALDTLTKQNGEARNLNHPDLLSKWFTGRS